MRIMKCFFILLSLVFFVVGCSNDESSNAKKDSAVDSSADSAGSKEKKEESVAFDNSDKSVDSSQAKVIQERMVVYEAQLRVRVKNFNHAQKALEGKTKKYGGYIVNSDVYREQEDMLSGTMTIRIPSEHFQEFLRDAEGEAVELLERNVSGKDITEEFVDLESRLRSKKAVENRLLEFMKNAAKTEDLLKISEDLANVQTEIEEITGKINLLKNQATYSTVTISLFEKEVIVPNIKKEDLNTWDLTKKQFFTSLNWLLSFFSGLFVFIIGNLPIFIMIGVLSYGGYYVYKKIADRKQN